MNILAIESSCDETAAAIISDQDGYPKILSNIVASQIDLHTEYGGVVPEVAARAHIESVIPTIKESLREAKVKLSNIDAVTVTEGPGLIGSLIVGVETTKAISVAKKIPLIPINHLEGHIYAAFAEEERSKDSKIKFPILTLLVSGGNTLLILMDDHLKYRVIGQTLDDAAGEAFDKGAKILGLGYPGGPIISKRAERGNPKKYSLPIVDLTPPPERDENGYLKKATPSLDFSFSGLKTALLNFAKKEERLTPTKINDLAASFQNAIVETLVQNSLRAIEQYQPRTFVLGGGVAANKALRETLSQKITDHFPGISFITPNINLCGDNAAMIGVAAYFHIKKKSQKKRSVVAIPNLKIEESV